MNDQLFELSQAAKADAVQRRRRRASHVNDSRVRPTFQQDIIAAAPGVTAQGAMFGNIINHNAESPRTPGERPATKNTDDE